MTKQKQFLIYGLIFLIGSALITNGIPSMSFNETIKGFNVQKSPYSVEVLSIEPDSINGYEFEDSKLWKPIEKKFYLSDLEIQVTNNRDESITLDFNHRGIVYNDGIQESVFKKYTGSTLPSKYSQRQFTLLPKAKKVFHMPFNRIDKSRDPNLIISFVENPTGSVESYGDEMSRGKRKGTTKEIIIPLEPYL